MRRRRFEGWLRALLSLGLSLGLVTTAQATYTHPTSGQPPTPMDLVQIGGSAKTLTVGILNMTPYAVSFDFDGTRSTVQGVIESNRNLVNSFMFAPVGWPKTIPAVAGSWAQSSDGTWVFEAASPTTSHPYYFVLAFNDQGGYVSNGRMTWNLEGVYNAVHGGQKNVPFSLWITRNKPSEKLRSEIFKVVADALVELIDLIGVAIDPENPIAWVDLFVASKELAHGSTEFAQENTEETGGEKMYAAAYVVPENADSSVTPTIWTHSTSGEPTDGIDAQWASATGNYSSEIVVTTHLLRGEDMLPAPGCCGSAPILGITLWTPDQYAGASAMAQSSSLRRDPNGRKINTLLREGKKHAFYRFCHLYNSLDEEQKDAYRSALQTLYHRKPLTEKEKILLEALAVALEKGKTSLPREGAHVRPHEHERPDHERPEKPVHVPGRG